MRSIHHIRYCRANFIVPPLGGVFTSYRSSSRQVFYHVTDEMIVEIEIELVFTIYPLWTCGKKKRGMI